MILKLENKAFTLWLASGLATQDVQLHAFKTSIQHCSSCHRPPFTGLPVITLLFPRLRNKRHNLTFSRDFPPTSWLTFPAYNEHLLKHHTSPSPGSSIKPHRQPSPLHHRRKQLRSGKIPPSPAPKSPRRGISPQKFQTTYPFETENRHTKLTHKLPQTHAKPCASD